MLPLLAGKPDDPTYLIAIGLGAFVLIYLTVLRPMLRKRKDPLERTPARTGLAQQRAVERDMQAFLVEYEQMIRNMTAGLDTRAAGRGRCARACAPAGPCACGASAAAP